MGGFTTFGSSNRFLSATLSVSYDGRVIGKVVSGWYLFNRADYQIYDAQDRLLFTVETESLDQRLQDRELIDGEFRFDVRDSKERKCAELTAQQTASKLLQNAVEDATKTFAKIKVNFTDFTLKITDQNMSEEQKVLLLACPMLMKRRETEFNPENKVSFKDPQTGQPGQRSHQAHPNQGRA